MLNELSVLKKQVLSEDQTTENTLPQMQNNLEKLCTAIEQLSYDSFRCLQKAEYHSYRNPYIMDEENLYETDKI